jgi:integrase
MIDTSSSLQWNIFARELQGILASRGLGFDILEDPAIGLHHETVRRLQRSLLSPKHLTILNPAELDRVMVRLRFTDLERQRMQAALLATAIEIFLMSRVDQHTARASAHQVFVRLLPIVEQFPSSEPPDCAGEPRWNIFARELEDVLRAHKMRIGQLDDCDVALHREKVRRLQRSLTSYKHLITLNPDELDRVIVFLGLSEEEQRRLQAALLATGVERALMDRIEPQQALHLASDLLPFLLDMLREEDRKTRRANEAPPVEPLIGAWLQHCGLRTHSRSTITTYAEHLSRFRDFLRLQSHDLLSAPSVITHFAPLWASLSFSRTERLAPLSPTTVHQRLAVLSSFYRFVVCGRFDPRFTTNPIPVHRAALSYRQAHPHPPAFDPQRTSETLQHLSCSTPEECRDYALIWIALSSARSPRDLLSLTIGDLHLDAGGNTCSLAWPESNPRLQLRRVHLCLPAEVAAALLAYLSEVYHGPLEFLDATLPLWVSFSDRNAGQVISAQTIADIALKHLGCASLSAFRNSQDPGRRGSQFA